MKRFLFAAMVLTLFSVNAGAQAMKMRFGGNFNINVDRDVVDYKEKNLTNVKSSTFQIVLKPKIYWYINEKMQFGSFIGIGYGNMITDLSNGGQGQTTVINPDGSTTITTAPAISNGNSLGWTLTPYYGYKLFNLGKIDIWLEASAYIGMYYKVSGGTISGTAVVDWDSNLTYGIQVMPVVDIALTDRLALQIHAGVLGLGWRGEKIFYADRNETISSFDLHKGGIMGLFQSIGDFGIGIVKRF